MGATHSSSRATHGSTTSSYNNHNHNGLAKGRRSLSKEHLHLNNHNQRQQHHHQYSNPNTSGNTLYPPVPSSPSTYPYYGHPQYNNSNNSNGGSHSLQNATPHHPSYSPPSSNTSHSSSSLQRAFGRRRSSNQTVDSLPSSFGSAHHHQNHNNSSLVHPDHHHRNNSSKHIPRYSEESTGSYHHQNGGAGDQEFRFLHGRRYHNTSSLYMLPNDTEEVDRLHLQHYLFKMIMGDKNIHVPIPKENGRVIDLGCGPATWTMDMATELTSVQFVGVDISPIYPALIHPRNCTFHKEDILRGIHSQASSTFDVVYQRNVAPGFTVQHWQQSFQEAFRLLKPGGWFESVESDITVHSAGPFTTMCFDHVRLSMAARQIDPTVVRSLDRIMIATGFVDVQVKECCVPLGEWGGKVGQLWKQNMASVLETVQPHLAKAGRMTDHQVKEMISNMNKETQEYKAYQTIYVTYGRKPL